VRVLRAGIRVWDGLGIVKAGLVENGVQVRVALGKACQGLMCIVFITKGYHLSLSSLSVIFTTHQARRRLFFSLSPAAPTLPVQSSDARACPFSAQFSTR
jgi:hypothetical protein